MSAAIYLLLVSAYLSSLVIKFETDMVWPSASGRAIKRQTANSRLSKPTHQGQKVKARM